jgi:tetratricopeptide (TPR) repeat protein
MTSRTRRLGAACLGLAAALVVSVAQADTPRTGETGAPGTKAEGETPPEAAAQAREHFKKGRELYQAGSYREALAELEAARALDPRAKDLVFNLGVVNEKLGKIDDALRYFRLYAGMELDAQERARADAYVKRLAGARKEVTRPAHGDPTPPPPPPPPAGEQPPPKGRADAATFTAAGFAVAGIAVGAVFGVKALSDQPSGFVTGRSGSLADYQRLQTNAHREAIISDVGFGVGLAAAALTAYLYFARPKMQSSQAGSATVSAAPLTGGGLFVLRASF